MISSVFMLAAALGAAPDLLVSTEALAAGLEDAILVDVREAERYAEGHIPGAVHLDVESLSETRGGVRGLLRSGREVADALGAAGIDPARRIVVYSGMEEAEDVKFATRMFWILEYMSYPRVAVLDGGFEKWRNEGRPIAEGRSPRLAGIAAEWRLRPRPELLADRQRVLGQLRSAPGNLLDMRSAEEYAGISKRDFVNTAGHIPGACNLPVPDVVAGPQHTFRDVEELREVLGLTLEDDGAPVITYCNTGRDATVGYFALRLLGREDVAIYDGSMTEWGMRPGVRLGPAR